jgi:ubiquinone biosynthesis protein
VAGSIRHVLRLARAAYVFGREGALADVDLAGAPPPALLGLRMMRVIARPRRHNAPDRIAAALARLGPSYIKLGQFLATRPDVVGIEVARDLEHLQDRVAPFPQDIATATVEAALGASVASTFADFGQPIAAASIAQVHKATVVTDAGLKTVAVKIIRPGVAKRFRRDLETMAFAARMMERLQPASQRLRPVAVVGELARSVVQELDLRLEASALSEMAENTRLDPGFRVPEVDWERTARDVLVIDWVDGIPLADIPALVASGHSLPALARLLIQSFLQQAMRDGFFHGDMHPGNLFVDASGAIVAVDLGIIGRLGPKERRFLAEILYGFITRDYLRVARVHFEAGYVPLDQSMQDFAQALRAIGEPIHNRTASQISMARLLTQLFEVTELFQMRTRTELVLLQKTMVVVEGVARKLDPDLNIWSASEPTVRAFMTRALGPVGIAEGVAEGASRLGRMLADLPDVLDRGERLAQRLEDAVVRGFPLAPESIEAIGKAEARRARLGHGAMWIAALSLLVIAVSLVS